MNNVHTRLLLGSSHHIDIVSLQLTAQTVSPFQFRNAYSDESYDAEVKVSIHVQPVTPAQQSLTLCMC